jgi:hypothetical protein
MSETPQNEHAGPSPELIDRRRLAKVAANAAVLQPAPEFNPFLVSENRLDFGQLHRRNNVADLMPFLKSKRRWLQFSLRTGFIVVTVLCVALSVWVVPLERKRRAVGAIEALDGSVTYQQATTNEPSPKTFLRRWLPQVYFDEIMGVYLADTQITDAELAQLQGLTSLQGLFMVNAQVTDAGLAHLKGLTGLQELYLNNTQVTDVGLAHLQGLTSLQGLWLTNTQVTDAVHMQGLVSLKRLNLFNTQVTDAGVAKLQQALPSCQIYRP